MIKQIFLLSLVCAPALNAGTYDDKLEEYKNAQRAFNELYVIDDRSEDISPNDQVMISQALLKKINSTKKKVESGLPFRDSDSNSKLTPSYVQEKIEFWRGVHGLFTVHGDKVKMPVNSDAQDKIKDAIEKLDNTTEKFGKFEAYAYYNKGGDLGIKFQHDEKDSFAKFIGSNDTNFQPVLELVAYVKKEATELYASPTYDEITIGNQIKDATDSLNKAKDVLNKPFNLSKFAAERIEKWAERAKDAGINLNNPLMPIISSKYDPSSEVVNIDNNNNNNNSSDSTEIPPLPKVKQLFRIEHGPNSDDDLPFQR